MADTPQLASIAALVGDPSRGRMLSALMDGRALTATELALEAGVTPSTASSHLAQLEGADVVSMARQGRHRYFRIASPEVASVFEALLGLAARTERWPRSAPDITGMRRARVCYDHLAGERGVQLLERLRARGFLTASDETPELTAAGEAWCRTLGIDLDALNSRRRPLCRPCLDWSERRTHLAGALGASILERMFALRLARREPGSRTVVFSPRGEAFLERLEIR
jgi:DNA-binding transcriptional ArsR family regulator